MNAAYLYRAQQLAIAAAIDSGDYARASDLLRKDLQSFAQYLPDHNEPERSDTTEHNQTLTPRQKCGIIKAIKRHVRRWKQKQEGKTMKKLKVYLKSPYAFAIEVDGKEVYSTGKAKDIASYCKRHFGIELPTETRNYPTGTKTHFDGLIKNGFEFDVE